MHEWLCPVMIHQFVRSDFFVIRPVGRSSTAAASFHSPQRLSFGHAGGRNLLNDGKLRHEVEDGDDSAANLLKLADEPEKYLGTVQVCLTLTALFSSAFAALHFAPRLAELFRQWGMTMEAGPLETFA